MSRTSWFSLKHSLFWSCLGALIATAGLLGNLLGVTELTTVISGRPRIQPLTACALLLSALFTALRSREHTTRTPPTASRCFAALVLLIGVFVLSEYAFGTNLGIDWVVSRATDEPFPGRPSPVTAVGLIALGGAGLFFDHRAIGGFVAREWLAVLAVAVAFVSLVGHMFGAGALYQFERSPTIGVSLPTGVSLGSIAIALLLSRPREGLMRLVTSEGPGGVLVRRLGLAAVVSGPLLGTLILLFIKQLGLRDLPLTLALGTVFSVGLALVLVVITALHLERAQETLEATKKLISALLEHAPEGIFIADLDGHYTEVNAAGCRLLGYPREELVGKTIVDLIPPEDVARLWQDRERLLQGEVIVGRWSLLRKDRTHVPVEVTTKVLPDGRWQAFARDISERIRLERELVESRDFLNKVLESSTEYGIIAEDLSRQVVLWNEGARRLYGYERAEICGKPSGLLVAPTDIAAWEALHARGVEQESAEGTILARRKDGHTFATSVVCTRRRGADDGTAGVLIVSRDLTLEQRHMAEQEFLARAGVELASCLEYREVVSRVVELVTGFLGDIATIDMLRGDEMERVRTLHREPEQAKVAAWLSRLGPARAEGHPLWKVLETREPVLLPRITDAQRATFATSPEHARALDAVNATSAMIIPLIARGQLRAVLSIAACHSSRTYGQHDLNLALEVARRAALALDNVQLFQESRMQGAMTQNLAEGAVLVRASDGRIVYANPRFEEMFGYGPKELIGEPVTVLNAGNEQEASELAHDIISQLTRSGRFRGEIRNVRKDGREFSCSSSISTFDHEDFGKVWIAVHTDITERKELEEKNAQALRDKEVLLKEIHHRVKNNLQVISSLFSLQRERTQNEELKRMLDESRTRVQSIALVHEHLYRSPDLAVVDFDQYLRSLVFAIRESYGAERVQFEVDADDVVLDVEEAVPCALLVCELVSNALKHAFAPGPGTVRVTARHEARNLCVLEVADNGKGVPADFDWKNARSLGLRLVGALSHQLRGTTELDRSAGTCFRIRFALRHPRAAVTTGPSQVLGHPGP